MDEHKNIKSEINPSLNVQNVKVERFEDISDQIRSSQKALAHLRRDFNHHRQDFDHRMSIMENLLDWMISKMETHKDRKGISIHRKLNQN